MLIFFPLITRTTFLFLNRCFSFKKQATESAAAPSININDLSNTRRMAVFISSSDTRIYSSTQSLQIGKVIEPSSIPPAEPSAMVGLDSICTILPAFTDSYITGKTRDGAGKCANILTASGQSFVNTHCYLDILNSHSCQIRNSNLIIRSSPNYIP